ncbi:MAG: hypothetical protein WBZ67_05655, partial [Pseudolabrys sp.]
GLPGGVVATLPSGAGVREEGAAFKSEEPAQERSEPLPVLPTPTHLDEIKGVVELIAEPEAAKPRKAGAAKGKAGANAGSNAKSKSNRKNERTTRSTIPRA